MGSGKKKQDLSNLKDPRPETWGSAVRVFGTCILCGGLPLYSTIMDLARTRE